MSAAIPIGSIRDLRGVDRDVKALLTLVLAEQKNGWRIEKTGKSHFRVYPPRRRGQRSGSIITVHGTSSDYRSIRNSRADLRREGLEIPR